MSLSGYEELANDGDSTGVEETTTATHDETSTTYTPRRRRNDGEDGEHGGDDQTATGYHGGARDDSLLTDGDGDLSGGTPRPPTATVSQHPQFADMNSPYENLRREMNHGGGERSGGAQSRSRSGSRPRPADNDDADESTMMQFGESNEDNFKNDRFDSSAAESELLVQRTARLPDMSMTPRPSLDERNRRVLEDEQATARRMKDPLMHRVLGKDYRIQATPHKNTARGISPMRLRVEGRDTKESTKDAAAKQAAPPWQSSPMSSPEMAVPKLRSAAFLSPMRAAYRSKLTATVSGPRTPGVSVQTLARSKPREMHFDDIETTETATKKPATDAAEGANKKKQKKERDEITWESSDEDGDDDLYGGFSPPKTISFAQLPSKLLQTPGTFCGGEPKMYALLTANSTRSQQAHCRGYYAHSRRGRRQRVRVQPDHGEDECGHLGRDVLRRKAMYFRCTLEKPTSATIIYPFDAVMHSTRSSCSSSLVVA